MYLLISVGITPITGSNECNTKFETFVIIENIYNFILTFDSIDGWVESEWGLKVKTFFCKHNNY